MRNPILAVAIAFALAASYTVAFAQAYEAYGTFQGQKSGKFKGENPPPPPPTKMGTVKPNPPVNPALQGNLLKSGGGSLATGTKVPNGKVESGSENIRR